MMTCFSRRHIRIAQYFSHEGFTLIETVVAVGTLGMFFGAIALILHTILQNVAESRVRTVASSLAQQKMELVRNLPYNQVGTVGGIPQGALTPTENIMLNGQIFAVITSVVYIDDPFDATAPADSIPTDYKRVRVEVSWGGSFPSRIPVVYVTNIAPKGIETSAGGGTLFIRVFNANGLPVENATVKIDNSQVNPQIHMQTLTDQNGQTVLPGAPICVTCYEISVTKSNNYSLDRTYATSEVTNPLQPHATIIEGQVTQISFSIDQTSTLVINSYGSREAGFPPIANVYFTLKGAKIIGYDASDEPVYKYSYATNTGGGSVTLPSLEWDTYTIDFTNSAHVLAGSNPANPVSLSPATVITVAMSAVPKGNTSLLVIMKNLSQQLLSSASAQLTNLDLGFDATKSAGATGAADMGQAFFGEITPSAYDLKITADGYQESTSSVSVNGNIQQIMTLSSP